MAHPEARVEIGTETFDVMARVLDTEERDPVWAAQKVRYAGFADYETKTARVIPVIMLARR